jgi:hypothetical protein
VTIKFHGLSETEGAVAVGSSAVLGGVLCISLQVLNKQTDKTMIATDEIIVLTVSIVERVSKFSAMLSSIFAKVDKRCAGRLTRAVSLEGFFGNSLRRDWACQWSLMGKL